MTHSLWYDVPLTCIHCGNETPAAKTRLYSSGLNPDVRDLTIAPGQTIAMERSDFDESFDFAGDDVAEEVRVLEHWGCPACGSAQYARVVFEPSPPGAYRLVSVTVDSASPALASRINGVSRRAIAALKLTGDERETELLSMLGLDG